jgi:hypothetical protein
MTGEGEALGVEALGVEALGVGVLGDSRVTNEQAPTAVRSFCSIRRSLRYADDALQDDKYEAPAEARDGARLNFLLESPALARMQAFTGLETDAT